ncbi:unnamed protein product [Wuchereria bancrofti]|uniref:Uncharacterized protein n=1 Tax=Wuchereria bancrofti TaxID=6293 RepID=A0A3P7DSU7_WUCBA|nr:unnamed protein product [Wuchereria bancrofti]
MLQQHRMIHLLLAIALITVCKGQYGEIAPPAPIPPLNYASNDPDNILHTSQSSYSTNEYENLTKQIIQSQNHQLSSVQLSHSVENITCGLLAEGNSVIPINSIPSVIRQSTTIHQKISTSASAPSTTSKLSPFRQHITASSSSSSSSSKSQSFSTRSSSLKITRQRTRQPIHLNVTTKHRRIISTSKKPISVVTHQSETTHSTQLVSRITQNHTRGTLRSTRLPSTLPVQPDSTKRPENRPISSLSGRLGYISVCYTSKPFLFIRSLLTN